MPDSIDTRVIHAGEPRPRVQGAVTMPIFQTAMYEYAGETGYQDLKYIRLNNTPNHEVLGRKLAALEGAEAALVTASGMAAISGALLAVLRPGDHLLVQDCLYGGTQNLLTQDIAALGIAFSPLESSAPERWAEALRPTTRAVYVETITNPLMQVCDLEAVAAFAAEHGLVSMIDNTFASPVNFRPAEWGFDLSLHSATKYLNGHSDLVAGAVLGSAELVTAITRKTNHLGGTLDPHACFLLQRGLATLALRVRRQNESALALARFLEAQAPVSSVRYPGLAGHPDHARAARLFDGFGGMLSFELAGGVEAAATLFSRLRLPIKAPSLGGVESLVTRPAVTSHAGMSPEDRRAIGISDGLVRVSVGIEASEDLIEDFTQALATL